MKYAIVNGEKVSARKGLNGVCQCCNLEVIPKCGKIKVWHWSHKVKGNCDYWWEGETEWHRNWKDYFPKSWQEIVLFDNHKGEKHIADVKNPFGLILEFQHSIITYEEQKSREEFYDDLVWVVDGCRNPMDKSYFNMGLGSGLLQQKPIIYSIQWWGKSNLLQNWADSKKKVYLDFGEEILWRLLSFNKSNRIGKVSPLPKVNFIDDCLKGNNIGVATY